MGNHGFINAIPTVFQRPEPIFRIRSRPPIPLFLYDRYMQLTRRKRIPFESSISHFGHAGRDGDCHRSIPPEHLEAWSLCVTLPADGPLDLELWYWYRSYVGKDWEPSECNLNPFPARTQRLIIISGPTTALFVASHPPLAVRGSSSADEPPVRRPLRIIYISDWYA